MTRARAQERLRQEREAFEQAKSHAARWFRLRLAMGYSGMVLLFSIAVGCGYILLNHQNFPPTVVAVTAGTLIVDICGLVASIFKLVLQQGDMAALRPMTTSDSD